MEPIACPRWRCRMTLPVLRSPQEPRMQQGLQSSGKLEIDTGLLWLRPVSSEFGVFQYADLAKKRLSYMKAKTFDNKLDAGTDISECLDLSRIRRPMREQRREIVATRYGRPFIYESWYNETKWRSGIRRQ